MALRPRAESAQRKGRGGGGGFFFFCTKAISTYTHSVLSASGGGGGVLLGKNLPSPQRSFTQERRPELCVLLGLSSGSHSPLPD